MEHYSRPVAGYTAPAYPPAHPSTLPNSHPYVTPPPHAVYHARPFWDPRATFLRRLIGIIIASAIVLGTIVLITWLALRPRLPQFRVDSLSLTHFNRTASPQSLLTANWDVRLTARNPNSKTTLYYDRVAATVFYKSESLSSITVPPFVVARQNETGVSAMFAAVAEYVDEWVVEGMNWERSVEGVVKFNVRMLARVWLKSGSFPRRRIMRVYCGELPVSVPANIRNETLVGRPRLCRVFL